jgi:hypothetical protein
MMGERRVVAGAGLGSGELPGASSGLARPAGGSDPSASFWRSMRGWGASSKP